MKYLARWCISGDGRGELTRVQICERERVESGAPLGDLFLSVNIEGVKFGRGLP